jgi:hypothetical protein
MYASDDSGIDRKVLKSLPLLTMEVLRTVLCDIAANGFFLCDRDVFFNDAVDESLAHDRSTILRCLPDRSQVHPAQRGEVNCTAE